jgi:hypothetical protein
VSAAGQDLSFLSQVLGVVRRRTDIQSNNKIDPTTLSAAGLRLRHFVLLGAAMRLGADGGAALEKLKPP